MSIVHTFVVGSVKLNNLPDVIIFLLRAAYYIYVLSLA